MDSQDLRDIKNIAGHLTGNSSSNVPVRMPSPTPSTNIDLKDNEWFYSNSRIILTHRWLVLAIATVVIAAASIKFLLATPMYRAEATLQIGVYKPVYHDTSRDNPYAEETEQVEYLNTQVKLLSSLPIAERVLSLPDIVQSLDNYYKRKNPSSEAERKMKQSSSFGQYTHSLSDLRSYLGFIEIAPIRNTSLVKVIALTTEPFLSAKLANTHADQFIQHIREVRQKSSLDSLVLLQNQATEMAEKVTLAERKVAEYAKRNAIVTLNRNENIVAKRMSEVSNLLTDATAKRIKSESAWKEALSGAGLSAENMRISGSRDFMHELEKAEAEYSMLLEKYTPDYPKMVQLKAKLDSLRQVYEKRYKDLVKGLEAQYKADLESERLLEEELEQQKSLAYELSQREVQYNILKREYESATDIHQAILRQLKEAQVNTNAINSNISLVEYAAVPTGPTGPNAKLHIMLAILAGLGLGVGAALIVDFLDNTFRTRDDLRYTLGLPLLGAMPDLKLSTKRLAAYAPSDDHFDELDEEDEEEEEEEEIEEPEEDISSRINTYLTAKADAGFYSERQEDGPRPSLLAGFDFEDDDFPLEADEEILEPEILQDQPSGELPETTDETDSSAEDLEKNEIFCSVTSIQTGLSEIDRVLSVIERQSLAQRGADKEPEAEPAKPFARDNWDGDPPDPGLITISHPQSAASEAFRSIAAAVLLSSPEAHPKTLLVTSSKKSEGKSLLVSNLAICLAELSGRTLVVDCDLRRPRVHKCFGESVKGDGLVEYLTGQTSLKHCIRPTRVKNIDIITSGAKPPNPVELLRSQKMEELMTKLRAEYEHILIDSPPVLPVTDPLLMSRFADGVLMVIRAASTSRAICKEGVNSLRNVNAKILGAILNEVDSPDTSYLGGYSYNNRYAYGYGYVPDQEEDESGLVRALRKLGIDKFFD